MSQPSIVDANWYLALGLTERATSLRAAFDANATAVWDVARAERRMARWRALPPFAAEGSLARRLAAEGLSEDDLHYLLGEPAEALRDRVAGRLPWLDALQQAFARRPPAPPPPLPLPPALERHELAGFLAAVEPLVAPARERVRAAAGALARRWPRAPLAPETAEAALFAALPPRLLQMLSRTLVLELHVARLQDLLDGETPEARFQSFVERLHDPEATLSLLAEYPVLARQLVECVDRWSIVSREFLARLSADWPAIRRALGAEGEPGALVAVDGGAGDSHRGGRSVLIARFESGFRAVYKPRPLALDRHFQQLLAWLNERGADPPLRPLALLDRGGYGWVEFVSPAPCATADEVRRFYERQGAYLALLYALEATDFHFENLIAAGEHPVLVDLEALFHPRVPGPAGAEPADPAADALAGSVLRVGLLPQRAWTGGGTEGIDLSGLGAREGQMTPFGVPQWEEAGTDAMRLTRRPVAMPGGRNLPVLDGRPVDAAGYVDAIVAGFAATYRLLQRGRDDLLAAGGPLDWFAADEARVILRPTQTYAALLRESFHPDVLRDALDRDRLFDRLWQGIDQVPWVGRVVPSERDDLARGDIPRFTARPGARDLWSGGGERVEGFFEASGLEQARSRLAALDEDDLVRQTWLIRASLATLAPAPPAPPAGPAVRRPQAAPDSARLLVAARAVGERLAALAVGDESGVSWIGPSRLGARAWTLAPLGLDLYDGLPGVTLFLAYLGAVTGDAASTRLARAALATIRRQLARVDAASTPVGGFSGWGGLVYALTHLGALWREPSLLAEADGLARRIREQAARDEEFDVVSGAAGAAAALLARHRHAPSPEALAAAVACGDRLLARATVVDPGLAWAPRSLGVPLAGFAHGAAGIAWALDGLAAATGARRFDSAARAAIAYERSLFSPEAGNWPDLRQRGDPVVGPVFMVAWCHGAPGIGLGRLRLLGGAADAALRAEVEVAARTTLDAGLDQGDSLCHGALGNLDFLRQASAALGGPWSRAVDDAVARVLERIEAEGGRGGTGLAVESPGLMTGLAGIGYGLLRLAAPDRAPSVLTLDPPPVGASRPRR